MSRTQTKPNYYTDYNYLKTRLERVERIVAQIAFKDVNTTGLTSAQIDSVVFGASTDAQPTDGLVITDKTNNYLLVRMNGKWNRTVALTVIP